MGTGEHMDAFISRGMVGQSSTTKDWFKSKDRFEQEIGAKVNRQDRLKTFAVICKVQDARLTLTHPSFLPKLLRSFFPWRLRRCGEREGAALLSKPASTEVFAKVVS